MPTNDGIARNGHPKARTDTNRPLFQTTDEPGTDHFGEGLDRRTDHTKNRPKNRGVHTPRPTVKKLTHEKDELLF